MHALLAGLASELQLCHFGLVTCSHRIHLFCRYAHITTSGLQQIYHVTILPQQQPAIVKFTQLPYPEEVHVECASQHLAPELLGVYPMPGGFTQV